LLLIKKRSDHVLTDIATSYGVYSLICPMTRRFAILMNYSSKRSKLD
jgi:hypothetical protein